MSTESTKTIISRLKVEGKYQREVKGTHHHGYCPWLR